jgi:hypothetical protein
MTKIGYIFLILSSIFLLSACVTPEDSTSATEAETLFANCFEGKVYNGKWSLGGTNQPVSVRATDDTMIVSGKDYDGSSYSYSGVYTVTGEDTATMKARMGSGANRRLSIKLTGDRFYASIKDDGVRSRGDINAVDSAPNAKADSVATVAVAMNDKSRC